MMKDWTHILRKRLLKERAPLPEGDWEVMERMLGRHLKRKRIARFTGLAAIPAAAAAAILLLVSRSGGQDALPVASPGTARIAEVAQTERDETSGNRIDSIPNLPSHSSMMHKLTARTAVQKWEPEPSAPESTANAEIQKEETATERDKPETEENKLATERDKTAAEVEKPALDSDSFDFWKEVEDRHRKKRTPIRISTSSALADNQILLSSVQADQANTRPGINFGDHDDPTGSVKPGGIDYSAGTYTKKYEHRQPRTYGLTINYALTDKVLLSSGLDYSYCFSNLTFPDKATAGQKAHYLGIPVHLDLIPVQGKMFSFYVGAGAEARKCIYATSNHKRLKDNGFRYSAICLVGLRYEPFSYLGVFVQPKYSWNFRSQDPVVRTAFTDSRRLFTVDVGLSLTLGR